MRLAWILAILIPANVFAQSAENILLVLNESSPVSLEAGQYYAAKRGVAASNTLRLKVKPDDSIARADYARQIESPIAAWLARSSAQDRILYIVLTKGIPLRIDGTSGADGTIASVDSELTLLYRRMTGAPAPTASGIRNPYFLGDAPVAQAKQFTHELCDIYLVTRLDGYTSADIRALIDRGFAPSKEGTILFDQKAAGATDKGNAWLAQAADSLKQLNIPVVLETTGAVVADQKDVLGYYSWGSNDPAIRRRHFGLQFVPGALAAMFVSSDGRTFQEPPESWNVGTWEDKSTHYMNSPQSLVADLIREGATGVAGHVAEPYLESTIRPNILFPAYASGLNLAESFYLAMPNLSWQTVVVGDPLCAPFRTKSMSASELDKGLDPSTELPVLFSGRNIQAVALPAYKQQQIQPNTTKLLLRAQSRLARGDSKGAREDLEEAVTRDGRLVPAQAQLAVMYEQTGEFDKAIARYRRLMELAPDNPLFLNNLAYALAVRKNNVEEAVPLAEKANALGKGNPNIQDTLGWIYFLQGSKEKALPLLEEAARQEPGNAEINFHAAVVLEASGQALAASQKLARALELDPTLATRPDVISLQRKIKQH